MLNLKKTALAVLALGSSAAFAGTMGPVCSAVNVTIPCESTAWMIGGDALYFQPSIGTASLDPQIFQVASNNPNAYQYENFAPNYNWGFKLEAAYMFNTGNDLNVNWYYINNNNNKTFSAPFVGGTLTDATGYLNTSPSWNMVNVEFGQHVDFGEFKSIRFHGGVEYSRLVADRTLNATGTAFETIGAGYTQDINGTYNGFGPRLGADLDYGWGNGLAIYANAAAALLVGSKGFTDTYTSPTDVTYNFSNSGSYTSIVPELDAKLGIKYTYAMAQGDLTFDAGWMWINYFQGHAYETSDLNSNYPVTSESNFGLQGVYFGMKWLGNVA